MNFIILADKYQKGMKSKGCVGLIKINNKQNIFQNQYKTIKEFYPQAKIIYVYGFEAKKFTNFLSKNEYSDVDYVYNDKYEINNQTFSLSLVSNFLHSNCFILFGDNILTKKTFYKFNPKYGSQIFISNNSNEDLGCIINDNIVENISFDIDNKITNMYYIDKHAVLKLNYFVSDISNSKSFLFEIINKMIDINVSFKPFFNNTKKPINFRK